jgi:flagellar motor protein MotB
MNGYPVRQHQQSEIFFVLFLFLILAVVVLRAHVKKIEEERPHRKPPIITLPEASGYRFPSGSAMLGLNFKTKLSNEIVPRLKEIADEYKVDVIEVIGHTDGEVISSKDGNLDIELENVALASDPEAVNMLIPASNGDLGLMRALSVIKFFQQEQAENKLKKEIQFRPYSAAQLLLPDGKIAPVDRGKNRYRRRIELRFTRSSG